MTGGTLSRGSLAFQCWHSQRLLLTFITLCKVNHSSGFWRRSTMVVHSSPSNGKDHLPCLQGTVRRIQTSFVCACLQRVLPVMAPICSLRRWTVTVLCFTDSVWGEPTSRLTVCCSVHGELRVYFVYFAVFLFKSTARGYRVLMTFLFAQRWDVTGFTWLYIPLRERAGFRLC